MVEHRFRDLRAPILTASLAILCAGTLVNAASWEDGYYEYYSNAVEPVSLAIQPDGQGTTFAEAQTSWGGETDATITLHCIDLFGDPFANIPAEDFWLASEDPGLLVFCTGGNIADGPTDANGVTTFTASPRGGGQSPVDTAVIVETSLNLVCWSSGLDIRFNSPDIDGDLEVDLADIGYFAQDFYGDYRYRSDLRWDGVINLSDLGILAQALSAECTPTR
jgi:hypothetical protein